MMLSEILKIQGWMNLDELVWLMNVARGMKSIVEIGAWRGRSSCALASGCQGPIYCVDTWRGSPEDGTDRIAQNEDIKAQFVTNTAPCKNIRIMEMTSLEAARKLKRKVDMVFIDGDHRYSTVKAEIEAWLPKTQVMIAGHDYGHPPIYQAVTDTIGPVDTFREIWYRRNHGK